MPRVFFGAAPHLESTGVVEFLVDIWIIYGLSMVNIWIIYLGKFDHDLTDRTKPIDDGECKGNHPQMGELFRLVNYSNLPRYDIQE